MDSTNEQSPPRDLQEIRAALLTELDGCVQALAGEEDWVDYATDARVARDVASALDAVDRVIARQPVPVQGAPLAPDEGTIKTAIWLAIDSLGGYTAEQADQITGATLRILKGGEG